MTSNVVEPVKDRIASINAKTETSQKSSDTKQPKKKKAIVDTKEESDEAAKRPNATKAMKAMKEPKSPKAASKNKTDEGGMVQDSKVETRNEILADINDSRLLHSIQIPVEPHDIEEGSNLTKEKPKATMIDIAREKAKEVIDASFHLLIAQAILFFQLRNCQISETVIVDWYEYGNTTISDIYDCNVAFELSNIDRDFMIAIGIATYSLVIGMIVVVHAILMRDKGEPDIQNVFKWTDRIPIIDCLLEIPICLLSAPFATLFLWVMDIACCVGLVILIIEYGRANHENGNTSAFILTTFLVSYDLYRLTGDIAQYYVINKEAIYEALKKKKEKIERLLGDKSKTPYDKVDEVVQDSEEGSC